MKYNELIEKLMPLVSEASMNPCVIWRSGSGQWSLDLMDAADNKAREHLREVRKTDPCAVVVTGEHFSRGSFPFVFDKVMVERLYAEYAATHANSATMSERLAIVNFIEDNLGEFSPEVAEFIAEQATPLVYVNSLLPFSMKTDEKFSQYDESMVDEAIDVIENRIDSILNERAMNTEPNEAVFKHNIEGYKERHSIQLAGRIVVLAEKLDADEQYMVVNCRWDNPFNANIYYDAAVTADYCEAVGEYINRQGAMLGEIQAERSESGLPIQMLVAADCIPGSLGEGLTDKLIVIKPDCLSPEYRTAACQLKICTGGNGAHPEARGNAVFCTELSSGKHSRFERWDVAGVADPAKLPEWAKAKLAELNAEKETPAATEPQEKPPKKASVLDALEKGKEKVAQADAARAEQGGKPPSRKGRGQEQGG